MPLLSTTNRIDAAAASIAAAEAAHDLARPSLRNTIWHHKYMKKICSSKFFLQISVGLALFFSYAWLNPGTIPSLGVLIYTWYEHPEKFVYRVLNQIRLERLVVTAAMTWFTTYLATSYTSEAQVLSDYENRISLQVNFLTQNDTTGTFELDWVTVSEEPLPPNKVFRTLLAKARKRPPALSKDCRLLCPLNLRGLLPGDLSDEILWSYFSSYASSKLLNNLGINHTLAGLPVKVSDIVLVLTFERDEHVGRNPLGRKMRLLCISKVDLDAVYENWLRREGNNEGNNVKGQGKTFLDTKTRTKWSYMRLTQLEELACHVHSQPMSNRKFDLTRCYNFLRLYTPIVSKIVDETKHFLKELNREKITPLMRAASRPIHQMLAMAASSPRDGGATSASAPAEYSTVRTSSSDTFDCQHRMYDELRKRSSGI